MRAQKIRKGIETVTGEDYKNWISRKSDREKYYYNVIRVTNLQPIQELKHCEKRGRIDLVENAFHLDHIISICYGYEHNISPKIIGDISNLRFIPALENIKKGKRNG